MAEMQIGKYLLKCFDSITRTGDIKRSTALPNFSVNPIVSLSRTADPAEASAYSVIIKEKADRILSDS
jgi:hypothetical protein